AERGEDVVGVWMRLVPSGGDIDAPRCCGTDEAGEDARRAAAALGIPFYALDYADVFGERVVDRFVNAYAGGETPNPCVSCNQHVKFDALLHDVVQKFGGDRLATGHYARATTGDDGRRHLLRARDPSKDQSYALYVLHLDTDTRAAVVGTRAEIARTTYTLTDVSFVAGEAPSPHFATDVVLRYRGTPLGASVDVDRSHATLDLEAPALVAPGQAAVFYHGDEVIGGGVVARHAL